MRYFLQRTRDFGVKYYSYDGEVTAANINFLRAHTFRSILAEINAPRRLADCEAGTLMYDLSPSILFDQKLCLTLPFAERTRQLYTDEARSIFPYAALITPEGFALEDERFVTLDEFAELPQTARNYFFKYAGSDPFINNGSRGVFFASTYSREKCRSFLHDIASRYSRREYWMIQKAHTQKDSVQVLHRDGRVEAQKVYSKFSCFYGPEGLLGIMVMQRPFFKVHGNPDTIVSIRT
jgi:hypothetical protein